MTSRRIFQVYTDCPINDFKSPEKEIFCQRQTREMPMGDESRPRKLDRNLVSPLLDNVALLQTLTNFQSLSTNT